jgi:hypothetical protein
VDDLTQARQWLKWWSFGPIPPPVRADTRRSLERLAKALDSLDPAARFVLCRALGAPSEHPIDRLRAATASCLASTIVARGRRKDDLCYALAVKFLVLAWQATHRCSPLTRWEEFQEFATAVTKDYGAPVPRERHVRRWL